MEHLTTKAIVRALLDAGEDGLTATQLYLMFEYPGTTQRRSNRVNQALRSLEHQRVVRRGQFEPTQVYRNSPVRRWHVLEDAARRYLGQPSPAERKAARARSEREWRDSQAEREKRRDATAANAAREIRDLASRSLLTKCYRRRKIAELRATHLFTLDEIGQLFKITRERVRQIETGRNETPCMCPACGGEPPLDFDFTPALASADAEGRGR